MSLPAPHAYRLEEIGPLYSIILGSPASGRVSDEYRQQAVQLCAAVFTSFTVSTAEGYFRGQREDSLVFQVATREPEKVKGLAAQLAAVFDQDGVGIVCPSAQDSQAAVYSRVVRHRPAAPD
jgi:hypothetical protein